MSRQVVNKNVITTPLKIKKINIIKGYTTNNNIPFFDPDRGVIGQKGMVRNIY